MPDNSKHAGKLQRRKSDSKRLDSWKAISSYMNRSMRTLRRWEENEGLPIHRHRHKTGDSVYAYCIELDAWRSCRPSKFKANSSSSMSSPVPARRFSKKHAFLAAFSVLLVAASIALYRAIDTTADSVANLPIASDKVLGVLISEPVVGGIVSSLDSTLIDRIKAEISAAVQSQVVPPERVRQAMRLMRLPDDRRLTPDIAGQLLLRDASAEILLIPHVTRAADHYLLGIEVVSDSLDRTVDFKSAKSSDAADIPGTLARLAHDSIERYRPPIISRTPESLPAVTAASLPAIRLYDQALAALHKGEPLAAYELLNLAVIEEPEFASAWTLLGWAIWFKEADNDLALPAFESAIRHIDGITAEERYFAEGSYQHARGNTTLAGANYNAMFAINPAHEAGAIAALKLCQDSRPVSTCLTEHARLVDLRPDDFETHARAAWSLAANGDQSGNAARYADRALMLYNADSTGLASESVGRMLLFPVLAAWARADIALSMQECERLRARLDSLPKDVREFVSVRLGGISLAMGRLDDADKFFDHVQDPMRRYELKSRVLFAANQPHDWGQYLSAQSNYDDPVSIVLLAMAGLPSKAQQAFERFPKERLSETQKAVIRTALALGNNDHASANDLFEQYVGRLTPADEEFYFIGLDMYARFLQDSGNLPMAISTLDITSVKQQTAAFNDAGVFWVKCQQQLARFYVAAGRTDAAAALEFHLRRMLQHADEDLKRSHHSARSQQYKTEVNAT